MSDKGIPQHVAVIMDGNGRWAEARGQNRIEGHKAGVKSVLEVVEAAGKLGVEYLTLYTFSTENWKRPLSEVSALMSILVESIKSYTPLLMDKNVRLQAIGDLSALSLPVRKILESIIKRTSPNTGLTVVLALNYGARNEILQAVKEISKKVSNGELSAESITEEVFSDNLYTAGIPDPELMIRTSGEFRLSNFLLWQLSYAELWVTDILWPDFGAKEFLQAIDDFSSRGRRYGGVKSC